VLFKDYYLVIKPAYNLEYTTTLDVCLNRNTQANWTDTKIQFHLL
jgi:hypothetical protein